MSKYIHAFIYSFIVNQGYMIFTPLVFQLIFFFFSFGHLYYILNRIGSLEYTHQAVPAHSMYTRPNLFYEMAQYALS